MDSLSNNEVWADMQGIIKGLQVFANALEKAHTWYQDNAETISMYLLAFADFGAWSAATDRLIENQVVFTDDLTQDLAKEICNSADADIEKIVCSYYFGNNKCNVEKVISRCQQNEQVQKHGELYDQIISAYRRDHYLIACIGLFSLIDGVLADVSEDTTTRFRRRLDAAREKIGSEKKLSEIDRKTLCIYKASKSFDTSIFRDYYDFSKPEPQTINRHWDLHGRTHREHNQVDFLKVLLWLDAIIFLSSQAISESGEVDNEHI